MPERSLYPEGHEPPVAPQAPDPLALITTGVSAYCSPAVTWSRRRTADTAPSAAHSTASRSSTRIPVNLPTCDSKRDRAALLADRDALQRPREKALPRLAIKVPFL